MEAQGEQEPELLCEGFIHNPTSPWLCLIETPLTEAGLPPKLGYPGHLSRHEGEKT